jgi:hypothetical protein
LIANAPEFLMPPTNKTRRPMTLERLSSRGRIEIAVDTEFQDALTLTIQAAACLPANRIAIQL